MRRLAAEAAEVAGQDSNASPRVVVNGTTRKNATVAAPGAPPVRPEETAPRNTSEKVTEMSILPRDISNRNKRKGFLKDVGGMSRTRTVFDDTDEDSGSSKQIANGTNGMNGTNGPSVESQGRISRSSRIVPPSEIHGEALPSNVFVSSASFPFVNRPTTYHHDRPESHVARDVGDGEAVAEDRTEKADQILATETQPVQVGGAVENASVENSRDESSDTGAIWTKVDRDFFSLPFLATDVAFGLPEGALVTWQVSPLISLLHLADIPNAQRVSQ